MAKILALLKNLLIIHIIIISMYVYNIILSTKYPINSTPDSIGYNDIHFIQLYLSLPSLPIAQISIRGDLV